MKREQDNDLGADAAAVDTAGSGDTPQRQETRVIGTCPRDGRYWENQCARCGSSLIFHECDNCAGEGWIEDDDWQADPGDGHDCGWCSGSGGHWGCISSQEWCAANPIKGREGMARGTVEWFTFDAPTKPCPDCTKGLQPSTHVDEEQPMRLCSTCDGSGVIENPDQPLSEASGSIRSAAQKS